MRLDGIWIESHGIAGNSFRFPIADATGVHTTMLTTSHCIIIHSTCFHPIRILSRENFLREANSVISALTAEKSERLSTST